MRLAGMKKTLVLIASTFVLFLLVVPPAQADHQPPSPRDVYWSTEGCSSGSLLCDEQQVLNVGLDNDMSWTSSMRAGIVAVIQEINSAHADDDGVGSTAPYLQPTTFTQYWPGGTGTQGTENSNSDMCDNDSQIVISTYDGVNIWSPEHGNFVGGDTQSVNAIQCAVGSSSQIFRAHITLADYSDGNGNSWDERGYWGADIPEPNHRSGERGLLTHELMHALGLYDHWEGRGHADTDSDPYCLDDIDTLPSGDGNPGGGAHKTLCSTSYGSLDGGGVYGAKDNYSWSLSIKDENLINEFYEQIDG